MAANDLTEVLRALRSEGPFLIASHTSPDGDSLGSSLALAMMLRARGARCVVVAVGGVPEPYGFLPGAGAVVVGYPADWTGALVVLDTPEVGRTGVPPSIVASARPIVNIDHHPGNTRFGDASLVDYTASATALLVHEVLAADGYVPAADGATLLYAGILADTGGFRFSNTDARTLAAAARLVELGAEPARISEAVYGRMPLSRMKLLGLVLSSARTLLDGRLAVLVITEAMKAAAGTDGEDIEELASYGRLLEGVDVAVLLREEGARVRASLRSVRGADVGRIAAGLGGGGHGAAAGAVLDGPLGEATRRIALAVSDTLGSRERA